jgi:hypothetical protein
MFIVGVGLLLATGIASAQVYNPKTTSVTSTTTPVTVLPPMVGRHSWTLKPRVGAAAPVLCFAYPGTVPATAPSDVYELSGGSALNDSVTCDGAPCIAAIGEAWACVLESGSTPVTVDASWR